MKKKVIVAVLCAVSAIGISVLLAYLISEFTKPEPVEKPANILEVSWYAEDGDEFVITTAEELREFAELSEYYSFEGQTVRLGADIVLNEGNAADFKSDPPKNLWKPIVNFAGTFDGQGHTISGLYAESYSNESALFIRTDYHCTLKNFSLKNSYFRTTGYVGSASIMANGGGTLIGIYSDAMIDHTGENVGGIASMVTSNSSFEECWFDGSITTTRRGVGGIVDGIGETSAEIKHCLFSGTIVSTYIPLHYLDSGARSGGLIGYVMNGGSLTTEDCLVCGTMKAENYNHSGGFLGVLGGNSTATVTNV
ncbi:MAG: hypothetical protein IK088_00040, partial [Lachnospiraceae bacterium]|nr:hypothetical protein [Lachnospiraceae bacterium]